MTKNWKEFQESIEITETDKSKKFELHEYSRVSEELTCDLLSDNQHIKS